MKNPKLHLLRLDLPRARIGAFTLVELLVVISIIAILASLIVGISSVAGSKKRIATTSVLLKNLETAIDSYKVTMGSYPPDSISPQTGLSRPAPNQLFYELTGTFYNQQQEYESVAGSAPITQRVCIQAFGRDGIQNVQLQRTEVKSFLSDLRPAEWAELPALGGGHQVKILVAPVSWPRAQLAPNLETFRPFQIGGRYDPQINPWQYRSTGTNRFNLQSFDLWADIPVGKQVYRINNWSGGREIPLVQ